jgi:site-specific DNA-methyltransferase (adenine-specific)
MPNDDFDAVVLARGVTLYCGNCLDVLATLPAASIDSVVCDPPYGLQFMGRKWDKLWRNNSEADRAYVDRTAGELTSRRRKLPDYASAKPAQMQKWHEQWAREVFRVMKPGAYLVAFGGTRTYHRMACAIEDAGFEVRDTIAWLTGQGFPKSHDVSKGIDRQAGVVREVIRTAKYRDIRNGRGLGDGINAAERDRPEYIEHAFTAPATAAARAWAGFGTALKPAFEPIILARKPLGPGMTVAANVLRYGTGGINIDGCRVPSSTEDQAVMSAAMPAWNRSYPPGKSKRSISLSGGADGSLHNRDRTKFDPTLGRWPANLAHDGSDEVLKGFPESKSGSVARYFYCAKGSKKDRAGSRHPCVKPIALMRWLVRLVTPPNGTCLDPFAGTGTTGAAAHAEGFRAIMIEREPEYQADIRRRFAVPRPRLTLDSAALSRLVAHLQAAEGDEVESNSTYNVADDFAKSIDVAYEAVRERVADGGPGWTPKPAV